MPANPVVKTLDVLKDDEPYLLPGLEILTINAFPFEGAKETLHRRVIITIPRRDYAPHNPKYRQSGEISRTGVGTALIGVQQYLVWRRAADKRHLEGEPNQLLIIACPHRPADHQARKQIQDHRHIQPAL